MFDRIISQIESMIKPYMQEVVALRKQLAETNKLLSEQNELMKKNTGCGCKK